LRRSLRGRDVYVGKHSIPHLGHRCANSSTCHVFSPRHLDFRDPNKAFGALPTKKPPLTRWLRKEIITAPTYLNQPDCHANSSLILLQVANNPPAGSRRFKFESSGTHFGKNRQGGRVTHERFSEGEDRIDGDADIFRKIECVTWTFAELAERVCMPGLEHPLPKLGINHAPP